MRLPAHRLLSSRSVQHLFAHQQTSRSFVNWRDLLGRVLPLFRATENASIPQRMDIRKDQFGAEAVRLLQDIADSHFIAFDFEFSGIAERNRDRAAKATVAERYAETRASVQEYQPLQIGLTIVKLDQETDRYVLEPYNLNISPLPLLRERQFTRKWSMNSGAVSFLQRNGFDFAKQMLHGVPYLSVQEEEKARARMTADAKREDLEFKPDDQPLVAHVRTSIAAWMSEPKEEQEDYLNIPNNRTKHDLGDELNSYQRRLVHQIVQNEYPGLKTKGMSHFVSIENLSAEKQVSMKQFEEEYRERDLARAVGFRWIIDGMAGKDISKLPEDYLLPAMPQTADTDGGKDSMKAFLASLMQKLRDRRKVLIGHNCMVDLLFLYKMTIGDLPDTLDQFRDKVHNLFPAIIDTKFLSSCYSEKHGRLALGEVYEDLNLDQSALPQLYTSGEFDRYMNSMWLHEAGYDSYITAIVAIKMAAKLNRDGSSRKKDHDRQLQEVAAAAADHPAQFGVSENYVTAAETKDELKKDQLSETSQNVKESAKSGLISLPAAISSVTSKLSGSSGNAQNDSTPASQAPSAIARVRSLFASTSIYDKLDEGTMPGEQKAEPSTTSPENEEELKTRLVKEGRLMPRWQEEVGFWDFYGNKLQVNGTQEGVLTLGDR